MKKDKETALRYTRPESGQMENSLHGMISALNYNTVSDSEQAEV